MHIDILIKNYTAMYYKMSEEILLMRERRYSPKFRVATYLLHIMGSIARVKKQKLNLA